MPGRGPYVPLPGRAFGKERRKIMFERILVPLDGSQQAEGALPVAVRLAHNCQGTLIFLEAVPPPIEFGPYWGAPPSFVQEAINLDMGRAADYRTSMTRSPVVAGVRVETKTTLGCPPR